MAFGRAQHRDVQSLAAAQEKDEAEQQRDRQDDPADGEDAE